MKKRVIVMGGGVAGMQTALRLAARGIEAVIVEKEMELGGKLRGWHVVHAGRGGALRPAAEGQ